ncbi:MAG: ABC transporter ATP-binding protein [Acidobacteria bacterium]|nr:MAG: ABC transporter ATP-binding protein [Acidobacteriota bacterium]RPJ79759.1 MAG: ABC transporter ATP-binding protein [Acidobacteriota bacterium]
MISYRGFTKRFGRQVAVEGLTLEVSAGETVALLGPNGSGKTTSLKAAAGLVRATEGEVLVGAPPRPAGDAGARWCCSFLPQKVAFPEALSGREVVDFHRALRGGEAARTDEVLRFASLNGAGDRLVHTYSGGMIQRLGLAVAMLPDAPILLLDEPTAALDPAGLAAFYGLVERRRRAGSTLLFTSHQLGDAERLADRVAVLVEGRLVGLFTERDLARRMADQGTMRVRLETATATREALAAAREVCPGATLDGDDIVVPGSSALRPAVLQRIQAAGGILSGLTTEEGRLDKLYLELVKDEREGQA